jgi:hypothetical protein
VFDDLVKAIEALNNEECRLLMRHMGEHFIGLNCLPKALRQELELPIFELPTRKLPGF